MVESIFKEEIGEIVKSLQKGSPGVVYEVMKVNWRML
jgi:hypothetical protein